MKLNKILALALSGVMAVSMLAGCSGASSNGDEGEEELVVATGIAATLNAMQAEKAEGIVEFTDDASLQTALTQSVQMNGSNTQIADIGNNVIRTGIINRMGYSNVVYFSQLNGKTEGYDAGTDTAVVVMRVTGRTETGAMNEAAKKVEDLLGGLKDSYTRDNSVNPDIRYNYTYAGSAAMVATENNNTPVYYIAVVVTCTTSAPSIVNA